MIIKLGETTEIKLESLESCSSEMNAEVLQQFTKLANDLKKIAPKAEDFLYFTAAIIHSAESAALNDDGTQKLNAKGEPVVVGWDKSGNTWRWTSNDPSIRAMKNSNGDIFPEEELIKAYKKWKYKPLCVDHKSSSVEHVRGFIVDTYYDRALKRVIALCALDKKGFPQLARNVLTGVSNNVSMGVAVGKAICYDCGKTATTEAEFCGHMRNKTCYGEINTMLNPIELSIVMTGADPKATIKHVLAAANALNTYVENKQQELTKLASNFQANLNFSNNDNSSIENGKITSMHIQSDDLESFRQDVDKAIGDFQNLQSSLNQEEKDGNNLASDSAVITEGNPTDSELSLQTPQNARFASESESSIVELHKVMATIEATLNQMKTSLGKLSPSQHTQEENMSASDKLNKNAYFHGAGGVNEPTPGQVKYPKDPLNEHLREHEDKQMVGQSPFPEVGAVDGMHPSPASADPSDELARKKMLARAEVEERAMKRNAIVELAKKALETKQGYWQGAGGINEPTPNKPKYPKDKLNEELRDYEDKQMVGQAPFPGVGAVDGLHPSPSSADPKDELKRKELLSRASLRGRFVKASNSNGSQNKAKSAWEIFLGDRLLLTASVEDLLGGKVSDVSYDGIANKEFGARLLERVKVQGADTVIRLIKKAQGAPVDPSSAPADLGAGVPADATPPVEDAGKAGDPKQSAVELIEKVRDLSSDAVEAVRALTGEQAEMGNDNAPTGGVGAPAGGPAMADDHKSASDHFSTAVLNTSRKELNGALTQALKETIAELNDHQEELNMIVGMYDKGAVNDATKDLVGTIIEESISDTKTAIANGTKLMTAFVKYVRGTEAIVKRAKIEAELQALAEGDSSMSEKQDSHSADGGLMSLINETNTDLDAVSDMMNVDELGDLDLDGLLDDSSKEDSDENDIIQVQTPSEAAEVAAKAPEASVMLGKAASLDSKGGRALLRAKLAADALGKQEDGEIQDVSKMKFSDMLDQADKLTDGQTQLDVKPSDNLGLVETLPEINKRMLEVAKMPPKVRKEAEMIQKMIVEGKLDRADVDSLVSVGLDKDAVSYWKKFYGEVDGGSEFASELVKEHVKAELAEDLNKFKVKLGRAYETAHEMAERGLCRSDKIAIAAQVDEIMKFSDENFESLKRVIARYEPSIRKEAGRLPQVGLRGDGEITHKEVVEIDAFADLSSALGTKRGNF